MSLSWNRRPRPRIVWDCRRERLVWMLIVGAPTPRHVAQSRALQPVADAESREEHAKDDRERGPKPPANNHGTSVQIWHGAHNNRRHPDCHRSNTPKNGVGAIPL